MSSLADLVFQKSTSVGTGVFQLTSNPGYQIFSAAFPDSSVDNYFFYFIQHVELNEREAGIGYLNGNGELVRVTVIKSSENGAKVNFSVGEKDVTNDLPAEYMPIRSTGKSLTGTVATPQDIETYQSGLTFNNLSVTEKAYAILPAPVGDSTPCLEYRFAVLDADGLRIVMPAGVVLYFGNDVTSSGGYIESGAVGSVIKIISINSTTYIATEITGIWSAA